MMSRTHSERLEPGAWKIIAVVILSAWMNRFAPGRAEHHAFPLEKHRVNERLVAHGGVQK